jgi:hypothetical protein
MTFTENRSEADLERAAQSRRAFLKGSAAAGVAALVAASAPRLAFAKAQYQAPDLKTDADILNFALLLEHIEAEFYKMAVDSGNHSGDVSTIVTMVRDHEVAHVDFLDKALRDAGYPEDKLSTADMVNTDAFDVSSQDAILKLASTFEPVGVGAYTAAAPLIENKDYLAAAGSIEQIEARHQGAIRWLMDMNPSPDYENALGPTMPPADVVEAVTPFLNS